MTSSGIVGTERMATVQVSAGARFSATEGSEFIWRVERSDGAGLWALCDAHQFGPKGTGSSVIRHAAGRSCMVPFVFSSGALQTSTTIGHLRSSNYPVD